MPRKLFINMDRLLRQLSMERERAFYVDPRAIPCVNPRGATKSASRLTTLAVTNIFAGQSILSYFLAIGIGSFSLNTIKAQTSTGSYALPAGAQIVLQLGHSAGATSFVFSSDQRFLLSAGSDYTLKLWDIGTGRLLRTFQSEITSYANQVVFSPDGGRVLSGGDGGLHLWNTRSGALLHSMDVPQNGLATYARAVAFSPDGKYLLSGHRDHKVRLWDSENGVLLRTFEGHRDEVGSVAFSPDGKFIVSAGFRGL